MPARPSMFTRSLSVLTVTALTATGLAVGLVAAPAAAADVSPVTQPSAGTAKVDALPTVQIDGVAWDQEIVGSTVFVGGKFTTARPAGAALGTNQTARNNLLSYNLATGTLNTAFAPNLNNQVKAMAASPDGTRLYVGGSFTTANGATRNRIAAYNTATGQLITSFTAGVDYTVNAIAATNSTVYVGGAFNSAGGNTRNRIAAFSAANGALLGWTANANATVNALVITPDGSRVIAGGAFTTVNGQNAYGLAALDATTGAFDANWKGTEKIRNAGASSAILSLKTDGRKVYGTGYHYGPGGNLEGTFAADPNTGVVEWVEDCHGDTYDHWPSGTGVVYTVSHAHYCGNVGGFPQTDPWSINMRNALAFTDTATGTLGHDPHGYFDWFGTPSPSMINWFPDFQVGTFTGKDQAAWSVTGNRDYVVMGGEFLRVNNTAQQGLVRMAVKPISPADRGPQLSGAGFAPAVVGLASGAVRVAWAANWDQDDHTLTYRLIRNNNTAAPIHETTGSNAFWNRPTMGFIDTAVTPGQTYSYRVVAVDGDGNSVTGDAVSITAPAAGSATAYAQAVAADGATTYWPLNEAAGAVSLDNIGFNDADQRSGVGHGVVPGAIDGDAASSFNGAADGFTATRTAVQAPDTFTVEAWVKTTSTSGGKIIGFGNSATGNSNNYDRHVYMDNAGRIWFGVHPGGVRTVNSAQSYNDGQWHHVVASLGAAGMSLSVDGTKVGSRADVTAGQPFSGFWRVGGDNIGGWPNQPGSSYLSGAIDDVAIYPTQLSVQAVNAHWVAAGRASTLPTRPADAYGGLVFDDQPDLYWRAGEPSGTTAADASISGTPGTYRNGVTLGQPGALPGVPNTAARFDGADDLLASDKTFSNPRTYSTEAWFKTTTTAGGKIIGFGNANTGLSSNYDRHVYLDTDGSVSFGVWTGQANVIRSAGGFNNGQWHHVVATQDTTTGMKLYLDGQLVGSNPQTNAQDYTGHWRVGGDSSWAAGPWFAGTIDEVAVYPVALGGPRILEHFQAGGGQLPNTSPTASFTVTPDGLQLQVDGSASTDPDGTIASHSWDFGVPGGTATGATAEFTYPADGTYQVTLTVTDNRGGTATSTQPVTVAAPPPNQLPGADFTVAADGATASVDAAAATDPDGTIVSYEWEFGDGSTGSGVQTSRTYAAGGTYPVTLTVTDDAGATASKTTPVTVADPPVPNQPPTAQFTATPTGLTAAFDGGGSADADGTVASYAWDFGDGTTGTGVTTDHTYAAAGSYSVVLTATDDDGAPATATGQVTVTDPTPANQLPTAVFTAAPTGLTVALDGSGSTDADGTISAYEWDFGDGQTGTGATTSHAYATAGTYQVALTVTDDDGGRHTSTAPVTTALPNVAPTAAFTASATDLAAAFDATTSTDPDGTVASYAWDFGDGQTGTGATASHGYAAAGTYQVTLTVTDDDGAPSTSTGPITVSAPVAVFAADAFERTVATGLGSADQGGAWTLSGGTASFAVGGGTGKFIMSAPGAGPQAQLRTVSAADVAATVQFAQDKAVTGGGTYVTVSVRRIGTSEYRARAMLNANGTVSLRIARLVNGTETVLVNRSVAGLSYAPGEQLTLRFAAVGTGQTALSASVWKTGTPEPTTPTVTATDSSAPLQSAGHVGLWTYLSGSATNAPVTIAVDNLRVQAPAAPPAG